MQLKIQINLSQDQLSPPVEQPAPFDSAKIRNFLLLVITLLSIIGFAVHSMRTTETPTNAALVNTTTNSTAANEFSNAKNNQTDIQESKTILADLSQNNTASNKSPKPAKLNSTALETNTTEKTLPVIEPTNVNTRVITNNSDSSSQKVNSPELEIEVETQNSINVSPAIVNNIKQKKPDELPSNQVMNKFVRRAQLTSSIISREPIDNIDALYLQKQTALYFFTEIHGKSNKKVIHRWVFKQKNMAEITHNIGGDKWRTYSSKNFDETMVGQWTVQVIDENNNVLKTIPFEVSL